jgi:hypothetical protein
MICSLYVRCRSNVLLGSVISLDLAYCFIVLTFYSNTRTLQIMAISESSRLKKSLEKEGVPVRRLIVNQVLPASNSDCKFCAIKRKVITY